MSTSLSRATTVPVHPTRGKKLPPEPLDSDEARKLIRACSRRAPTGKRNAAMIAAMLRCGLRVSELLGLDIKDLDRDGATMRVLHGKGDKHRMVGVDPGTMAIIDHWIAVRPAGSGPLFSTLAGERVQSAYMRSMLKRMARRAGITKRVHPHGCRHTFSVGLSERNVPVPVISKCLGHANSAVTARYLDHVRPQQVIDAMQAIAW